MGSLATNQPGPTQTIAPWGPRTAAAGHREASFVGARLLWRKEEVKQGVAKINQGKSWKRDFAKVGPHPQDGGGELSCFSPPIPQEDQDWGGDRDWGGTRPLPATHEEGGNRHPDNLISTPTTQDKNLPRRG